MSECHRLGSALEQCIDAFWILIGRQTFQVLINEVRPGLFPIIQPVFDATNYCTFPLKIKDLDIILSFNNCYFLL